MGGLGSGSWPRSDKKTTTDECHSIDIRYLNCNGLLSPGREFSLSWSRAGRQTGSISGVVDRDQVVLIYRHRSGPGAEWEYVDETVPLEWMPCNLGGERPWFLCPGMTCGRRIAILYGPGKYFLCRHCYDLRYESQYEDKENRALRRAQKIRKRLGGSANMLEPFPERPKGMHHDTYMRLLREHDEAHKEQLAEMHGWLDKFKQRVV